MALSSTDPKVLMGQAKCFSCLSPKLQYQLRTYLLALIAMGDTSITGVQALSVASTCFSCLTHGELLAAKQYLMALWLGLDTTKTGIVAQAKTAACDYACLTPVEADQVQTYLLAVTAGVATDAAGMRALELAAKCFECPTNKRQLETQVYLLSTLAPGAPTTASAIMQAAGCFLPCVPAELHSALSTSLFTQVAGRSTPPCVTPTAPSQPSAFSTLDTILKISWTQPANSGSLIQSYTVSYGTTQGGPYTATKTVQAGTKQAILTGLSSGTTYYFVVVANSFTGCSSANSAEGSAATTGTPPVDPAVTSWTQRVINNGGGAVSNNTITAVDNFWKGIKQDGLDTLIVCLNLFVPDSLTACLTPFIVGPGNNPWTNHNFVAGDLTVNGLAGDAATKYLDTGFTPSTGYPTPLTGQGLAIYVSVVTATGITAASEEGALSNWMELVAKFTDNNTYARIGQVGNVIGPVASPGAGLYSNDRVSTTNHKLYFFNSGHAAAQLGATDALGSGTGTGASQLPVYVGCFNDLGVPQFFCSDRVSLVCFDTGFSLAQFTLFAARAQTLRTALGGGFA